MNESEGTNQLPLTSFALLTVPILLFVNGEGEGMPIVAIRPLMLRTLLLVSILWSGLVMRPTLGEPDYAALVLPTINRLRLAVNLPALCVSNRLNAIAQEYADKQAALNQGGHTVDGTLPRQRVSGANPLRELLVEGLGVASADLALSQVRTSHRHQGALLLPGITHVGVGRGATTDAASGQAYYYWTILLAGLAATPCPVPPEPFALTGRRGVAEWVAPSEEMVRVTNTFSEPVPGAGGVETLRRTRKRFLDTLPRIVDGSQIPSEADQPPRAEKSPSLGSLEIPVTEFTREYRPLNGDDESGSNVGAASLASPSRLQEDSGTVPRRIKRVHAHYESGYPPYVKAAEAEPPTRFW